MPLFALTLFLGAALLFVVQPMVAKAILPSLGGSAAVWNVCSAFFQTSLLLGYAYAYLSTSRLGVRRQAMLQAGLLALALGVAGVRIAPGGPLGSAGPPPPGGDPTGWLLRLLIATVGLPYFVLSTTAPLLQRWYARTGHPEAHDPYFLYAASNLGSLAALLAYPFVIEPRLHLERQYRLWVAGYGILAVLLLGCAAVAARSFRDGSLRDIEPAPRTTSGECPAPGQVLRWVVLAFVPSSLMLGVTTYVSTDIAAIPLLWIIPLALYLLSFSLVFARRQIVPHGAMVRLLPIAAMVLAPALAVGLVQPFWIPLHLVVFFSAAMVCHGELARQRPPAQWLTTYYLALAMGGVLGGLFNALIAPAAFDRLTEYPLAIVLACLLVPGTGITSEPRRPRPRADDGVLPLILFVLTLGLATNAWGWAESVWGVPGVMLASGLGALVCWTHRARPARFALSLGAVLLAFGFSPGVEGKVLLRERNFYGFLRVTHEPRGNYRRFFHGNTLHGQQCLDPARRREPLTYFTASGPIGQVFEVVRARPLRPSVAIVGLGVGSLACYAEPGQRWSFYELDPAVVRVARDPRYFTFLDDCRADRLTLLEGDARLRLRDAPGHGYGLIVLDAFNSDAVPVHLLTREALRLYRSRLAEGGLIVFNITNRYLDLNPVVGALARDAGWTCRVRSDLWVTAEERRAGKEKSIWAVLAARPADLGALASDPRWEPARDLPGRRVWTDDYSSLVEHLTLAPAWRGGGEAGR